MLGKDITARVLERGLQASALRQQVLANNIANINTPGFKRARVEFESQLAAAMGSAENPESVSPKVVVESTTTGRPDGNNVDIDQEMTEIAENQIWYAALTRQISDHFSRLRMVIRDGR